MASPIGPDTYVDVTDLVKEKGYRPVYCGPAREICKLINPKPLPISSVHEPELKKAFKVWLASNGLKASMNLVDRVSVAPNSSYQYTCTTAFDVVDVYQTKVKLGNQTVTAFFRMEKEQPLFPYDTDGWVIISENQ